MADILARIFAQKFSDKTRQPVVVENRTGAGGVNRCRVRGQVAG